MSETRQGTIAEAGKNDCAPPIYGASE